MAIKQVHVGDTVRIREYDGTISEPAVVKGLYDIPGGFFLDRAVFGFTSWNVSDVASIDRPAQ